ncbi:ATP-binding protein [Streptomyces sp. NPDC059564]|uniref:ATP-binding protein n=1 Tax=Streptomyces sp. NPDC059564 TaxID=3346865 RepID=UPI003678CADB
MGGGVLPHKPHDAAARPLFGISPATFSQWGRVFGYGVLATAMLDRLGHQCKVVSAIARLRRRSAAVACRSSTASMTRSRGRSPQRSEDPAGFPAHVAIRIRCQR